MIVADFIKENVHIGRKESLHMPQSIKQEVKLNDIERIALPKGTRTIAGDEYGQRIVNWVVLLSGRENISAQVEKGDLVLCPPAFVDEMNAADEIAFIKQLATSSVSGVVLFRDIKSETETAALDIDLPIFIMPDGVVQRELQRDISSLLLDRQNQIAERGMQLYRELSELSRDSAGMPQMAQAIGRMTDKIVVIQDKRLEMLAIDRPESSIPVDDSTLLITLSDQEHLPAVLRNRKAAAKATRSHWQQLLFPQHNVSRLISPIISGDRARGYLSIIGPTIELDALDITAVEQGAAACALEMAKVKAVNQVKNELRGNFLEGILAGTVPKGEIERLSARLDHDTAHPHAVMTFKWDNNDSVTQLQSIDTTLNWLLSTNNRPTLVHMYGGDHVVVFTALRNNEDLTAATRLATRLRTQLKTDYPDMRLVGGIAGPTDALVDWPSYHQQALQAMEVGQRLSLEELVEYSSLGVYRLLGQLDDIPAVKEFCEHVIGPLVKYDLEHRSNLVHTIEEYFNHHGNVSQTAEALFIHRNTLLYRLERIQELTEHDLNQSDMRLALHLALKLWQLRGSE